VINGTVVNSVLSPGVRVDVGAVVRDSIVMFDSIIRSGAVVDRSILDKEVVVGQGAIVGDGPDFDTPNRQEPGRLNTGITVIGKRAVIPRGSRIGRNVKVAAGVRSTDFTKKVIPNGASVEIGAASKRQAREERNTAVAAAATPAESTNGQREAVPVRAGARRVAASTHAPED
jgi:NDP-sugar pyrophosphorylase family protein